jgi:hypothetical protein
MRTPRPKLGVGVRASSPAPSGVDGPPEPAGPPRLLRSPTGCQAVLRPPAPARGPSRPSGCRPRGERLPAGLVDNDLDQDAPEHRPIEQLARTRIGLLLGLARAGTAASGRRRAPPLPRRPGPPPGSASGRPGLVRRQCGLFGL